MIVKEKKPIDIVYYSEHPVSARRLDIVKITIVKWNDGEEENEPTIPPRFADASGVSTVARLRVPLYRLPVKNLKTRTGEDGREWYIVDYKLRVRYTSSETVYELRHNDKGYGSVEAEYV
ncbi:MAG: hypothetical protein Q9208_008302 [Pyrenodesmia sp. 3 TL-2023]